MVSIQEINTSHAAYAFVEQLWQQAFPQNERRDIAAQRWNIDQRAEFHCLYVEDEGVPIGFVTYWELDGFCYVEHFATDATARNRGYGCQIMATLQARVGDMPIVLEVEMPEDALSIRRVGFYERQGFTLWSDWSYIQPPYRNGDEPLPMRLMVWGDLLPERDFARVSIAIHRAVYGVAR